MKQNIIALVYDFDGTLTPKTMQEYTVFPRLKLNPDKFWSNILTEAAETAVSYTHLTLPTKA